ncbi:MAG: hypothetical protein ACOX6X_05410 [Dethiobacteria bacterium]
MKNLLSCLKLRSFAIAQDDNNGSVVQDGIATVSFRMTITAVSFRMTINVPRPTMPSSAGG